MNIIPWRRGQTSPLAESDFFEDFFNRFWGGNGDSFFSRRLPEVFQTRSGPAVNISESPDSFCVTVDCPGMTEKDIQVEAMGNSLLISGERRWEEEKEGKEYRRIESHYGRFQRSVALPENVRVEPGEVDATYHNGVLSIKIPKIERTPATKIEVHAG
jgi:HSP20 family protein